jgi:hypothetical protein
VIYDRNVTRPKIAEGETCIANAHCMLHSGHSGGDHLKSILAVYQKNNGRPSLVWTHVASCSLGSVYVS